MVAHHKNGREYLQYVAAETSYTSFHQKESPIILDVFLDYTTKEESLQEGIRVKLTVNNTQKAARRDTGRRNVSSDIFAVLFHKVDKLEDRPLFVVFNRDDLIIVYLLRSNLIEVEKRYENYSRKAGIKASVV